MNHVGLSLMSLISPITSTASLIPGIFPSLAADGAYFFWRSLRDLTVLQTEDADDIDIEKQEKKGVSEKLIHFTQLETPMVNYCPPNDQSPWSRRAVATGSVIVVGSFPNRFDPYLW